PEVINGKGYTFKSDIYSIAILMWEISFGQPPFMNYEHDCIFAINIIDGIRPKIISEIPSKYKNLIEQCWDANPLKRPDINTLRDKMNEIMTYYRNKPDELPLSIIKVGKKPNNIMSSKIFTSKIHNFENLHEPKNATEEEQIAFYTTRSYDFSISSNDEVQNNPNLHSEEKDKQETSDDGF
ncbi:kinase-like protein, partial [Rhizophagus irregularis]